MFHDCRNNFIQPICLPDWDKNRFDHRTSKELDHLQPNTKMYRHDRWEEFETLYSLKVFWV